MSNDMEIDIIDMKKAIKGIEKPPDFFERYEREKLEIRRKQYVERLNLAKETLAQAEFAADAIKSWNEFLFGNSFDKQRLIREMRDNVAEASSVKKLIDVGDARMKMRAEETERSTGATRLLFQTLRDILFANCNQGIQERNSECYDQAADLIRDWRKEDMVQESSKRDRDVWDKTRQELWARKESLGKRFEQLRVEIEKLRNQHEEINKKAQGWKEYLEKRKKELKEAHFKEMQYWELDVQFGFEEYSCSTSSDSSDEEQFGNDDDGRALSAP